MKKMGIGKKLTYGLASLGLSAALMLSCATKRSEQVLYSGTVNGQKVEIVHEDWSRGYDIYKITGYDKDGKEVWRIRNEFLSANRGLRDTNYVEIEFDDGTKVIIDAGNQYKRPPPKLIYPDGSEIRLDIE